jgi:hypothetical protein
MDVHIRVGFRQGFDTLRSSDDAYELDASCSPSLEDVRRSDGRATGRLV